MRADAGGVIRGRARVMAPGGVRGRARVKAPGRVRGRARVKAPGRVRGRARVITRWGFGQAGVVGRGSGGRVQAGVGNHGVRSIRVIGIKAMVGVGVGIGRRLTPLPHRGKAEGEAPEIKGMGY